MTQDPETHMMLSGLLLQRPPDTDTESLNHSLLRLMGDCWLPVLQVPPQAGGLAVVPAHALHVVRNWPAGGPATDCTLNGYVWVINTIIP
jgi:hypothetical protein